MKIKQKSKTDFTVRFGGFTLIEILVVIGIIAVLIGLGATSYSTAQKKARDTKRKADIQSIRDAYEQYYSICGFDYPTYTTGDVPTTITCASPAQTIVATVPTDPLGDSYQIVAGDSDAKTYTICPPIVRGAGSGDYYLETEDCNASSLTCCVTNAQ